MTDGGADGPAALDAQRDFLLRSLDDLEREHDAGDVDDHDYEALKGDYTARAAAALRAVEIGRAERPAPRRRPMGRRLATAAGVVAFAVVAGVLMAQASGRRDPGQFGSGDVRQSVTEKLNEAGRLFGAGRAEEAVTLYDEVLQAQPTNAEALTYKGWAQYTLIGDREGALTSLLDAATAQPDYPDVHAFLAVVFFRSGLVEQAAAELGRLDALDPPPDIVQLTASLRTEIAAALAATTTTTAAAG